MQNYCPFSVLLSLVLQSLGGIEMDAVYSHYPHGSFAVVDVPSLQLAVSLTGLQCGWLNVLECQSLRNDCLTCRLQSSKNFLHKKKLHRYGIE